MKKLDRILVPTDYSKGSQAAYKFANFLCETIGGTVDLFHIIPTLKYFQDSFKKLGVPINMIDDYRTDVEKSTKTNLEKDMADYVREGYQGRCITKIGPSASEAISDYARQGKYDLIVMGVRGNSADRYIKMGSVTTRVVKLSSIPVFTIPETPISPKISHILMSTDYSDESLQAIKPAAFLAYKTGAKITLFHVLELYSSLSEAHGIPMGQDAIESSQNMILNKIRGFLTANEEFNCRLNFESNGKNVSLDYTVDDVVHKIPVELKIDKGFSAHHQIVDYANKNADLMVISTHGRSGLAHLMLGSTTEKTIQWAEIPVLTNRVRF